MNHSGRYVFRPLCMVGLGGLGCSIILTLRALLIEWLGELPGSARFLACEFESDPPRPPATELPWIATETWDRARLSGSELALLSLGSETRELAERIASDEKLGWLRGSVPENLLADYSGNEACQIPAFSRLALALAAYSRGGFDEPSWFEMLDSALVEVSPGNAATTDLDADPAVASRLIDAVPTMVIIGGTQGGTASGAILVTALAARALAAERAVRMKCDAHLVTGCYRPKDGQERRKSAIEHSVDLDVAFAMTTNRPELSFALGPEHHLKYKPRLFDRVFRQETRGDLANPTGEALYMAAQSLAFRYFSDAGLRREKSRGNDAMSPRVKKLSREKFWAPVVVLSEERNS